jgi:hypothetical protein
MIGLHRERGGWAVAARGGRLAVLLFAGPACVNGVGVGSGVRDCCCALVGWGKAGVGMERGVKGGDGAAGGKGLAPMV